uniref:Uncharacterized protein n=1 Tax=Rhizophora mucronata TaxID=61149 RepID=A0A2P2K1A3_RHIMU
MTHKPFSLSECFRLHQSWAASLRKIGALPTLARSSRTPMASKYCSRPNRKFSTAVALHVPLYMEGLGTFKLCTAVALVVATVLANELFRRRESISLRRS